MFKKLIVPGLVTAALVSGVVAADQELDIDIRPGLWEHSFTIESESGEMERAIQEALEQLEKLPESQRRMVESMMESQGINLDLAGSSVQVCITEEDIRAGNMPQQDDCEQTIEQQGDSTYHFVFECTGSSPHSGSGTMQVVNREHYRGSAQFTTEMSGSPELVQLTQEGQWLQEDCNDR